MARNMIISSTNHVDTAISITADDEVATLPVENLQDRQIVKIWRNAQTSAQIDVDFGQGRVVNFVALIKHSLSQLATIRFRFSNEADFTTNVYDSGTIDAWPVLEEFGTLPWGVFQWGGFLNPEIAAEYTISTFNVLDEPVVARFLRIDMSDASNPEGYIEAGRLIAGPAYQPSINYANGVEFEFIDESRVTKSRGGQIFVDEVERYRRMRFELINIPEAEMFSNVFNQLDRLRGISQDILVIPQPDEPTTWITQNIYGRISQTGPIVNSSLNFYSRLIEIEEII